MGRAPCCDKANVKRGPWSPEEDAKLKEYMEKLGTGGNWIALPQKAGLKRCGKSCRLRWLNYLRPNIKHGEFSDEEDRIICTLYASIGSRWSIIAGQLPGRTDNDIKNYWNTKLKKKLMRIIPSNYQARFPQPFSSTLFQSQSQSHLSQLYNDHYNSSFYLQSASKSLTSIESSSISVPPNNFLYSNNSYQLSQLEGVLDLQYNYVGKKENNNNMLVFGGNNNEASNSSSDRSCNQISYGGKGHHHHVTQEEVGGYMQGFVSSGLEENYQNFMVHHDINGKSISSHGDSDLLLLSALVEKKQSGILENHQLECDMEEVKQLISSGNICNSLLFNDENKTDHEKGMYQYY